MRDSIRSQYIVMKLILLKKEIAPAWAKGDVKEKFCQPSFFTAVPLFLSHAIADSGRS